MSAPMVSADEFTEMHSRLERAAHDRGGGDRGALVNITAAEIAAAAREVRVGRTVSLAAPVKTDVTDDNPQPAKHDMIATGTNGSSADLHFALDRLAMNIHGNADSHLDALCHVVYQGELFNAVPADKVGRHGAAALSVNGARDGIVGRGVLLDIPRLRGVRWLEPGDHVTVDELTAAEKAQGVRVGKGDLLFVRVGHRRRRNELGPWNAAEARAGLHPRAVEFLAERQVGALGSDGNNDTAPSIVAGVDFPVHVLAIQALGVYLLDYLQFEELVPMCEEVSRWSFLCVIAPLRLPTATGSPVNPIALL